MSATEREGNEQTQCIHTDICQFVCIFVCASGKAPHPHVLAPLYSKPYFPYLFSFRPGAVRSGGRHVSPPAFSGTGSGGSRGVGRCWRWSSPGPLHPCHGSHLAHAVQLHVPLVALGPRGPARQPNLHFCHSSACQWPTWPHPPDHPQPCGCQPGWLDDTDGRYCGHVQDWCVFLYSTPVMPLPPHY